MSTKKHPEIHAVPVMASKLATARLDALSRPLLTDLVIDLVRRLEGDEALDGRPLIAAIEQALEPVTAYHLQQNGRRGVRI